MGSHSPVRSENINILWGSLLIEELIRNGINYFCISPGSRSAPLAVAVARHPKADKIIIHDERGAAFHAVGYARATGKPAVLICTSGTAAANYYPAFIEAAMDKLPMLVISADRPPELQETGANQTIRQSHLFGTYAKWFFELPCPTEAISATVLLTTVDQAVYQTHCTPAGPVHLNCPFREPLVPVSEKISTAYINSQEKWFKRIEPYTRYPVSVRKPEPVTVRKISELVRATRCGIVSIGRLDSAAEREATVNLVNLLQWPAFVDITSGLRLCCLDAPLVHYFDQLLLSASFQRWFQPDVILHLGGQIVSKRFFQFTKGLSSLNHSIVVKSDPFRQDPTHRVSLHVEADLPAFYLAMRDTMEPQPPGDWTRQVLARSALVDEVITGCVALDQPPDEIATARLLTENVPSAHGLWVASSMPIREVDMVGSPRAQAMWIGANRGTSGIEGTLAAAAGFAKGLHRPVTVLLGDLAFLHDLNSLVWVQKSAQPLVMVVINNRGGGIFSFLPIAQFPDVFEECFAAPHDLEFKACAELFGLTYVKPATNAEFVEAYRQATTCGRSTLIEVATNRQDNYPLHRQLQALIAERLDNYP